MKVCATIVGTSCLTVANGLVIWPPTSPYLAGFRWHLWVCLVVVAGFWMLVGEIQKE